MEQIVSSVQRKMYLDQIVIHVSGTRKCIAHTIQRWANNNIVD